MTVLDFEPHLFEEQRDTIINVMYVSALKENVLYFMSFISYFIAITCKLVSILYIEEISKL